MRTRGLLDVLRDERKTKTSGGIYHKVQVELAYNSNHIEGSSLSLDETRWIFETATVQKGARVDDVVETANHFRCLDLVIDRARHPLSELFIKKLHAVLKNGTADSRQSWFNVGGYKRLPNEVGGRETASPEAVGSLMRGLVSSYNESKTKTLYDLLDFHWQFECIHPFQDGNGRVGRLILFKECLGCGVVPFIIKDENKWFYYRGLHEWQRDRTYLVETCRSAQDEFKAWLEYFRVPF